MPFCVSAIQMAVTRDIQQNAASISRAIHLAHKAKADILLTPEGGLSGYTPDFDQGAVQAALEDVTRLARSLHVGLALGTCFKEPDGQTYDELRFYTPDGSYLGFHSKILLCGTMSDPPQGEINDYASSPLQTFLFGDLRIGGLVCNDLWANPSCTPMPDPHLTHQLAQSGAQVVFHAVNGGRDGGEWSREVYWHFHEVNLRIRAQAGKLWIVTVDNCDPPDVPCAAPGGVINPQGQWICRTEPQGEQFFAYRIESADVHSADSAAREV